jgi:UDP-N-acetyl-D-mannosaminuronate dehydrogenase
MGEIFESEVLTSNRICQADCVVIATDHRSFDWHEVVEYARLIVDTRNVTARLDRTSLESGARIVKLGSCSSPL